MSSGNVFYVQSEKEEIMDLADLPENIRAKVEDAFRRGQKKVIIQNESSVIENPSDISADNRSGLSIEKTLSILSKIKDSYRQSRIKPAEYENMVLEVIQDYLAPIDDDQKIRFVVNGILDSEFMSFLNDEILNKLRGSVIGSVSNKP